MSTTINQTVLKELIKKKCFFLFDAFYRNVKESIIRSIAYLSNRSSEQTRNFERAESVWAFISSLTVLEPLNTLAGMNHLNFSVKKNFSVKSIVGKTKYVSLTPMRLQSKTTFAQLRKSWHLATYLLVTVPLSKIYLTPWKLVVCIKVAKLNSEGAWVCSETSLLLSCRFLSLNSQFELLCSATLIGLLPGCLLHYFLETFSRRVTKLHHNFVCFDQVFPCFWNLQSPHFVLGRFSLAVGKSVDVRKAQEQHRALSEMFGIFQKAFSFFSKSCFGMLHWIRHVFEVHIALEQGSQQVFTNKPCTMCKPNTKMWNPSLFLLSSKSAHIIGPEEKTVHLFIWKYHVSHHKMQKENRGT